MRAIAERHRPARRLGALLHATAALALVLGAAGEARAQRQSGIQLTPDSAQYLISKDVGNERWAIAYNLDDKTVTGNVFPLDGGSPSFLACRIVNVAQAPNPGDAQYSLECQFAQSCPEAPCANQWGAPFPVGPIPGSFFLPTGTQSTLSGNVQPIFSATCATNAACHIAGGAGPVNLSAGASYFNTFLVTATQDPNKFYVNPFASDVSYLMNKVDGTGIGSRMPLGGPFLSPEQADLIRRWIVEGAANN